MNPDVFELGFWQMLLAYVFIVMVLVLLRYRGIRREKILVIATLRMTVQLVLMGYVLMLIIDNPHPLFTFLMVLVMISFAVYNVFRKFSGQLSRELKGVIALTLPIGAVSVLFYFLLVVIRVEPYYNPQYFIPISGMIIGNSMTGITLAVHTLINRFTDQRQALEEALYLGATPKDAAKPIVNESFDAAIMPTINNMLGLGIIFLPGMMTGQILSGVDPTLAILYQIGIMLGILGGVALSTYLLLVFGYKTYFNDQQQLRLIPKN